MLTIADNETHEMLQIEMAAKGCISGTLSEWPHLKRSLKKRGIQLKDTSNAQEMQAASKTYLRLSNSNA